MLTEESVLIVGCGKMGGAILNGLINQGCKKICVVEPNEEIRAGLNKKGIMCSKDVESIINFIPTTVFTAVKPFMIGQVIDQLKQFTDNGALLLSIIAGKQLSFYQDHLGTSAAIVRAMPNTPAAIGQGITGVIANKNVSENQKNIANQLLKACGETVWLSDESEIDTITAISGSGPAYVFYLTEALANAAIQLGLSKDIAEKIAIATVCGSADLMKLSQEKPATLRQNVTTPNGTTAAALEILMDDHSGMTPLMEKAALAAKIRSIELGKN